MKYVILIGYQYDWPDVAGVADSIEKATEIANNAMNSAEESFSQTSAQPYMGEDYKLGWDSLHMACRIMEVPQS